MSGLPLRLGSVREAGRGGGSLSGPDTAVDGNFAAFDGTDGKKVRDSGSKAADFAAAVHTHTASQISDASANGQSILTAADYAAMRALLNVQDGADQTGTAMASATAKATPVDADTMPLNDSAASNALKKVTWANIKATLKTYFDTLYQPLAAKLTALAGQTWAADQITYQTNTSAVSTTPLTSFGRSLIDDADAATARSTLGLVIGTNVQAYDADLAAIAALTPTNGNVITGNGTTWVSQAPTGAPMPTMIVRDEKASGTSGGGSVGGSWTARDLNTVDTNTISGASLASNQITLPAGTYQVSASTPAISSGYMRGRLYNVTDSAPILNGTSEFSATTDSVSTASLISGRFTIAASKVIRLETYVQTSKSVNGLGTSNSGPAIVEIYSQIEIAKVG